MKIHFFGAAGEVTGSCYLIETHDTQVLVDCGIFQGASSADERNRAPLSFDPTEIAHVIITHAHLDHCGRVPLLFARGYRGPVFATEPTCELIKLQWDDMLEVMRMDFNHHQKPMLYDAADVERAKQHLKPMRYDRPQEIANDVSFLLRDAGHIFGSAWVEFRSHGKVAVFSGDIGNDNVPIVHETVALVPCDILVTEATYGDRLHSSPRLRRYELRKHIIEAIQRGGTMMIAAFSIERTQEILFELDQLIKHERALPHVPIFLDSPLAIRANDVYRQYPQYFDEQAMAEYKSGEDFLNFPGLRVTYKVEESKKINSVPGPKIIIAGSGMLSGGRIMHHLMRYLPDKNLRCCWFHIKRTEQSAARFRKVHE